LLVFAVILQTVVTVQMLCIGYEGLLHSTSSLLMLTG